MPIANAATTRTRTSASRSGKLGKRKARAIAYKGGACADCGGVFRYAAFEFHHTDPARKELTGNQIKRLAWDKVKAELDHCVLLCANCHRLRHWRDGWRSIP